MGTRTAAVSLVLALAGCACGQGELFAVDFQGNLYTVNPTTGEATLVAFTGRERLSAAAADAWGFIYAARFDPNELIRIDSRTGLGVRVAPLGDVRGLAFDPAGVLYGLRDSTGPDDLVRIDMTTGALTLVGPTGRIDLQGLTITDTGEFYAIAPTGTGGTLVQLNPATGAATVISTELGAGSDVQSIEWAQGNEAFLARANLRRVDLTTGATTLIGAMGPTDVRGLAIVPQGACYANCDTSTTPPILNVADFTCFLQRFAARDPYANCDNSTTAPVLNVQDFTCFLQSYAAGCP